MAESATSAVSSPPMPCPACGQTLYESVAYCPFCGKPPSVATGIPAAPPAVGGQSSVPLPPPLPADLLPTETPKPTPPSVPVPVAAPTQAVITPPPASTGSAVKSPAAEPRQSEPARPEGQKRSNGCLLFFLALGLFGGVAWVVSGLTGSLAAAEQCESALGQTRIALAATRIDEARAAHDQAATTCPADHSAQLETLAGEIEQAEISMQCAGVEAEAAALLGQAQPQRAQRLLDEQAPRCGSRNEYRNLTNQVDVRIRRAERAMMEAWQALQRSELDAAEAALARAERIDAGVVGTDAVKSALAQARQAALELPIPTEMPPALLLPPEAVQTPPASVPSPMERAPPSMGRVPPSAPEPSISGTRSEMQRQITGLLRGGEEDLARRNYRGAITKAETALLLDPGNRDASGLKRRAEAAEQEALRDIEIR